MSKTAKIKKAIDLYEAFSGNPAEYIDTYNYPVPDIGVKVGLCDGIMYTTNREGIEERYIHKFKKASRPLLAVTFDGKNLVLIGGSYLFTERGIIDK